MAQARKLIFLSAIIPALIVMFSPYLASASLVTDASLFQNAKVIDFSQYAGCAGPFPGCVPPLNVGGKIGKNISFTGTSGQTSAYNVAFYLLTNGWWNSVRNGYVGLGNNSQTNAVARFTFSDGPLAAAGAFINYAPNSASGPMIRALDSNGTILESYDIPVEAPVLTLGQNNQGAFRGILRPSADIAAIEFEVTGVMVLDDLTFSSSPPGIPEPGPPIVLIHGWCGSPASFGKMAELLEQKLQVPVRAFDYSDWSGIPPNERASIEKVAGHFGQFLKSVGEELQTSSFDIVAHSMGGLVTRAWMTGLVSQKTIGDGLTYQPGIIRRTIFVATPHYGTDTGVDFLRQIVAEHSNHNCDNAKIRNGYAKELQYGSKFLKLLHEQWGAVIDKLPPTADFLSLVGCSNNITTECQTDHIVNAASATMSGNNFTMFVRYVPKAHITLNDLGWEGIADVNETTHSTFKLTETFFTSGMVLSQENLGFIPELIESMVILDFVKKNKPYAGAAPDILITDCIDFFTREFTRYDSKDASGWVTLVHVPGAVPPACREIEIDMPRKFIDPMPFQILVPAGRSIIIDPIEVVRKK